MTIIVPTASSSMLLSDVDGVLFSSYRSHLRVTEGLLALIGDERRLTGRPDERQRFGLVALTEQYGPSVADALLSARPALMAASIDATPVVTDMVEVLASIELPTVLITAGHAGAVRRRLGDLARHFEAILGCEDGPKQHLLAHFCSVAVAYVCDTMSDVRKCRAIGIPAFGVSWGFDSREELITAGAVCVIDDPAQLIALTGRGGLG